MSDITLTAAEPAAAFTTPLESFSRFCKRTAVSRYQARRLIDQGRLEFVRLGTRNYIPVGAYERLLDRETAKCRAMVS